MTIAPQKTSKPGHSELDGRVAHIENRLEHVETAVSALAAKMDAFVSKVFSKLDDLGQQVTGVQAANVPYDTLLSRALQIAALVSMVSTAIVFVVDGFQAGRYQNYERERAVLEYRVKVLEGMVPKMQFKMQAPE